MAAEEIFNKILSRQLKLADEIDKIVTSANLLRSNLAHLAQLSRNAYEKKHGYEEFHEAYKKMAREKGVTRLALSAQESKIRQAGQYSQLAHKEAHDMLKRFEEHFKSIQEAMHQVHKLFR